jgi:hypothetical protein
MRIGLIGYFDIGKSYGLGDDAFPVSERAPEPDISLVGIQFPLGQGLVVDLLSDVPEVVALWRDEAVAQVTRPEMETGWSQGLGSRERFDHELKLAASQHPITCCELRIHAVGTVLAELRFAPGVPLPYAHGLSSCFEYAAYRPAVADALQDVAERHAGDVLGSSRSGLVELSRRALPQTMRDSRGYEERMLFSSGFTQVIACIDENDDVNAVTAAFDLRAEDVVVFEHHGSLHYGWGTCVLEPNQVTGWQDPGGEGESPEQQIMRMEACIRVAQAFLGTCEAFTRLFETEMHEQVGGYVENRPAGRTPEELNRLRTLALAVVNLTSFDRVSPTEEDRAYFRKFNDNADLDGKHQLIQQATEVLYNVQVAETQNKDSRRQWILSLIIGLLTSLTLISVTGDAYDFIRDDQSLIAQRFYRLLVVSAELALILAILVVLVVLALRPRRGRRGG